MCSTAHWDLVFFLFLPFLFCSSNSNIHHHHHRCRHSLLAYFMFGMLAAAGDISNSFAAQPDDRRTLRGRYHLPVRLSVRVVSMVLSCRTRKQDLIQAGRGGRIPHVTRECMSVCVASWHAMYIKVKLTAAQNAASFFLCLSYLFTNTHTHHDDVATCSHITA